MIQRGSAMGTTRCILMYFAKAIGAQAWRGLRFRLFAQFADKLHEQKYTDGHEQKVYHGLHECAQRKYRRIRAIAQGDIQRCFKVYLAC